MNLLSSVFNVVCDLCESCDENNDIPGEDTPIPFDLFMTEPIAGGTTNIEEIYTD